MWKVGTIGEKRIRERHSVGGNEAGKGSLEEKGKGIPGKKESTERTFKRKFKREDNKSERKVKCGRYS
jgi:hypothetical protein